VINLIRFVNVSKEYKNGVIALYDINIEINKGEFVFLVGSSGAGKSTLIKLLLKEEGITRGKLFLNGADITRVPNRRIPFIRRQLGVVFQDFRLLPNKTVYENVAFAMEIIGASPRAIRRRVPTVLSMVDLSRKASSNPDQLSGGEQQRVSIARSIVNNPPVLIADEPTGNLDRSNSIIVLDLLKTFVSPETTVIITTHATHLLEREKDYIHITVEDGRMSLKEVHHEL
jgi:cell division transport system ATP-binding protein